MAFRDLYHSPYGQLHEALIHLTATIASTRHDFLPRGSIRWGKGVEDSAWEYSGSFLGERTAAIFRTSLAGDVGQEVWAGLLAAGI
jgi:hypothetical protein